MTGAMESQSASTDRLSEQELFGRWSDRWSHFLSDFLASTPSTRISERLRDKVKSGNAERAIAGGHEGREILELLQNARDAISEQSDGGRVYIGISDDGVLVANTGQPFDLFDPAVEDAVTMIGESAKGNSETEIGHKGVGLKSILATGDAFEIWTRHTAAINDMLRVRLSRAYVTSALLSTLGYDTTQFELRSPIADDSIRALTQRTTSERREEQLTPAAREDIGKLPLFDFPVPLEPTTDRADPISERAEALLTGNVDAWYGEPFRTAVFVEYEDDEWRSLLDAFDLPEPDTPDHDATDRAERLWSYLSKDAGEEGLTAETLVQFGGIETLLLERIETDSDVTRERWDVNTADGEVESDLVDHQTTTVSVDSATTQIPDEHFDQFEFGPDASDSSTQLLVPRSTAERDSIREYPLYLYYPIENTRDVSLPFCLHGHFTVETNRKDLSLNSLDENRAVLEDGVELVANVAEAMAGSGLRNQYPWVLLPPPIDESVDDPSSQASLLSWFRASVYEELRERACVPVVSRATDTPNAVRPAQTLLHGNRTIRDGFIAFYDVVDARRESVDDVAVGESLPTRSTLTGCQSFPETWDSRIESLLSIDNEQEFSSRFAESWGAILGNHLTRHALSESDPHLVCEADTARTLFRGTIETILLAGRSDSDLSATLSRLSDNLEDVHLLPCQHTNGGDAVGNDTTTTTSSADDDTETLLLVPVEARSGPDPNDTGTRRSRSVIWDIHSPERDVEPPEVPLEKTSFRVYFLDRVVEQNERVRRVLEFAGRPWGVRVYNGTPSYFRELLDTFATAEPERVKSLDFYFLAKQIDKLGNNSDDLQTHEGSFLPVDYVESAVAQSDGDQRQNLRRRINLRNNDILLPRGGGRFKISKTILDDDWQRIRAEDREIDTTDEWGTFDAKSVSTWPSATAEPWAPVAGALDTDSANEHIAKTLTLLGASVLPGVSTVWMYGSGHPRTRGGTSWNPVDWNDDDFVSGVSLPENTEALRETLHAYDDRYQEWITAPGRHPQTTAEHSNKCDVKTDGVLEDVFLATWVWLDDSGVLADLGEENLLELLRRYDTEFNNSILETGWTCSHGHQRDGYGWSTPVPTLLNWQLRELAIWEDTVTVEPELTDGWGVDGSRLAYAVAKSGSGGARASRLFPHIEPSSVGMSDELLRTLGVKPIDAFDATDATWHLQRLLETLAVAELGDDPVPLHIPNDRQNDWNAAYNALLKPIMEYLPAEDAAEADFDPPFLSHLPIRVDGEWCVASLEWIETHADDGRYYEDQSPKPWERRAVEAGNHWLLPRTGSGPFIRLADALGVRRVDASKPVFDPDELTFSNVSIDDFRSALRDRAVLLIASLEQRSEDRITTFADELDVAISELRVAERVPEVSEGEFDTPRSGLYAPRDGEEAFVFNASAFDDGLALDGLANAVSLLAEQPTNIATFREALDSSLTTTELTKRWQRRTFPVEHVERVLGTKRRRDLRDRLVALADLATRFDDDFEASVDDVLESLEREGEDTITVFEQALHDDTPSESLDGTTPHGAFLRDIRDVIPRRIRPVLTRLVGSDRRQWNEVVSALDNDHEPLVIDWLATHQRAVDATSCFSQPVLATYKRMLAVQDVWDRTDTEELHELDVWCDRLRALSSDVSVSWTDEVPDRLRDVTTDDTRVFYYTPKERLRSVVVEPFLETLVEAVESDDSDLKAALRQYILDGEFPTAENTTTSAADHQDRALDDLQTAAISGHQFSTDTLLDEGFGVRSASSRTGGSGRGGGSTQYRGRGQQGEAATLVAILDDAANWLADEPDGTIRNVRSRLKQLHNDQQQNDYDWHLDRVWNQELLPLLSSSHLTRDSIVNWREYLGDDRALRDHPFVRVCNVTLEHGPGFDVIDPFGSLSNSSRVFDAERAAPVEVKAVGGTTPPFHFRLTTNEYRRCKAFLRGGQSYIIRLVYVPDTGTDDWTSKTQFVSEIVLCDVDEADALVSDDPFEEVVKGGYMNMSVDE